MTQLALPRADERTRYHHEAFFWTGVEGFLERAVPFVGEALAAGMPVMVAVPHARWRPLRAALGSQADRVAYVDMSRLGRNPARIVPAWRSFVDEHAPDGVPMRGIAEPIWAGRRPAEVAECQVHEAMMNRAIPALAPLRLLCPYDAGNLDDAVLEEARRSHPVVADGGHVAPSASYAGHEHLDALASQELPAPAGPAEQVPFGLGDLVQIRRLISRRARDEGLEQHRVDDLVLAVNEVAANSLDHGGGGGVLELWREDDALVVEVRDGGRLTDLMAGRLDPEPGQARGRGLWMVNRLADLVQIRSNEAGTVVRVSTWL